MKPFHIIFVFVIGFLITSSSIAQTFQEDMKAALTIHDTTKTVRGEIEAMNAFKALSKKYSGQWLPDYWAAYLCTQVARLKGRVDDFPDDLDPRALIYEAQQHFDTADKRLPQKSTTQQSDFHMLQGFIYNFQNWIVAETEEEKERYTQLRKVEYKAAARLNPRNPLLMVLNGIALTGEDKTYQEVIAGIVLMEKADEIFSAAPNRSMTTYWNKDFIPFWKSRAEKRLATLLNDERSSVND